MYRAYLNACRHCPIRQDLALPARLSTAGAAELAYSRACKSDHRWHFEAARLKGQHLLNRRRRRPQPSRQLEQKRRPKKSGAWRSWRRGIVSAALPWRPS